ncbi:hypothetical protein MMC07_008235 [Pseudocyphellaria aurata]|nr:hypothetical protein [Pseudocyphellaria aurata]
MVLLAYSGALLLTCGSLVFGRSLRPRSEKRNFNPSTYTPSSNNIGSTFSDIGTSGISLGTTPDAPNVPVTPDAVPGTSWTSAQPPNLSLQDTYLETAFVDPNAPRLSPASQQLPHVDAPTNHPLYSFDAGGGSNTNTPLPPDFIPALPGGFHEMLMEIDSQKPPYTYYIFTLSANKRNLKVTAQGRNDYSFPQALRKAEPGFAIHSILTDTGLPGLLVLTNFHHLCEKQQPDGSWKEVPKCLDGQGRPDDRRRLLKNILYNTWFKAIEQVFEGSRLKLEDEITVYCHDGYHLKSWSSPDIEDSMGTEACPPPPY